MRVAFLTRMDDFGIGNHIKYLSSELIKLDVESKIFSSKGNLRTNLIPLYKKKKLESFDVIHIQGTPYGGDILKLDVPKVVTVHTLLKEEIKFEKKISFLLGQVFEERCLKNVDSIIVVNSCLLETLKKYPIPDDVNIDVIMNGVDVEEFDSIKTSKRCGILYGGRKAKRKNYNVIRLAVKMTSLSSKTFGFDRYLNREDLVKLYKNSKMFVNASEYETGPTTVMEAMAARCPVISKDVEGMVWAEGIYRSFSDFGGLVEEIKFLDENDEECEKIANRAYNYVRKNLSWEDVAKRTLEIYEKIQG